MSDSQHNSSKFPKPVKCVFNYRSLSYELRYVDLIDIKTIINWKQTVSYLNSDYDKWNNVYLKSESIKSSKPILNYKNSNFNCIKLDLCTIYQYFKSF